MILVQKLFRHKAAAELEIKAQRDTFDRQAFALKSEAEMKLAEAEALLETERERNETETNLLKIEQEKLRRALAEQQRRNELLEEARREDQVKKHENREECGNRGSQNAMEVEDCRLPMSEERTGEELTRRSENFVSAEMEKLERSLESERNRILDLENRLKASLVMEQEQSPQTNTANNVNVAQALPVSTSQSETLFNVLLAEIMSLQLMYQMQGLSCAYHVESPESRDSGCAEYDDVLLESVSTTLLEKGELILNSLRDKQRRESRVSLTSTDSFRELYILQFPSSPSPKVSLEEVHNIQRFHSASLFIKEINNELPSDSKKSVSSDNILMPSSSRKSSSADDHLLTSLDSKKIYSSDDMALSPHSTGKASSTDALLMVSHDSKKCPSNNGVLDNYSSSSLESFCEEEPLSPRLRSRPSDNGCSSQYSDSDQSSSRVKRSEPIEFNGLRNQEQNCVVPLAEEEDEDIDSDGALDDDEQIQSLKKRVLYLGKDLLQLKSELDGEMISFFSDAFGVDVPLDDARADLSHVMRILFEGVTERLLTGHSASPNTCEGEEERKGLNPVLLEEALNLLLVNKTVMSCVLILQSRRSDDEKEREEQSTEMNQNTVIHLAPKVDRQIQVDLEPSPRQRRRIRKETGVGTDPLVTPSVRQQDTQTSREELSLRLPNVSCSTEGTLETVIPTAMDPWICRFEPNIDELDSDPLDSDCEQRANGPPCGTCSLDSAAVGNQFTVVHQTSSEEGEDVKRGGKKKKVAFSCLGFARRSFKRSSQRKRSNANQSKS